MSALHRFLIFAGLISVCLGVALTRGPESKGDALHRPHANRSLPRPVKPPPPPVSRIGPEIDSAVTLAEATGGDRFPRAHVDRMELVSVTYLGFDGLLHVGQIVVHEEVAGEVRDIFAELLEASWPIEKVVPIARYGWSDEASIADNNTSAFNYRRTIGPGQGRTMSMHSYGRAIDINPFQNPYLNAEGNGDQPYDPDLKGTITRDSPPYRAFRKRGWRWGGDWVGAKDYQHFEKGTRSL